MRSLLVILSLILPLSVFAAEKKMKINISANGIFQIANSGVYEKGGPREGKFFSDLMESAPDLRYRYIEHPYEWTFAFEIHDYYLSEAIKSATEEGNQEAVNEYVALDKQYGKIKGDVYRQTFLAILNKQFDRRVELMAKDLEARLQHHNGNFATMLEEYRLVVERIEAQNFINGVKKVVIYGALGTAFFATAFLGVPALIAL